MGAPQKKILIADDEPTILLSLRQYLESCGYVVFEAGDGNGAVEMARRVRPDIVLLDLDMPIKDGFWAARTIRLDAILRETPIIFITGHGGLAISLFQTIDELGPAAIEYLPKPFGMPHLQELVSKCLGEQSSDSQMSSTSV